MLPKPAPRAPLSALFSAPKVSPRHSLLASLLRSLRTSGSARPAPRFSPRLPLQPKPGQEQQASERPDSECPFSLPLLFTAQPALTVLAQLPNYT